MTASTIEADSADKQFYATAKARAEETYQQISAAAYREGYADCLKNLPPQMR